MTRERKAHWEQVYQSKDPTEVSWHQTRPEMSLALIQATGAAKGDPIIDVGGGASRLVDYLLDEGYQDVSVLDISDAALAHSRARLGERSSRVHWLVADATELEPPRQYVVWHDRAVFHFLTDAGDRARYVQRLRHGLVADGHVIIATFGLEGPTQCSGLEVMRYDAAALKAELGPAFELQETRDELHRTPAGKDQAFTCFRFRYKAESG